MNGAFLRYLPTHLQIEHLRDEYHEFRESRDLEEYGDMLYGMLALGLNPVLNQAEERALSEHVRKIILRRAAYKRLSIMEEGRLRRGYRSLAKLGYPMEEAKIRKKLFNRKLSGPELTNARINSELVGEYLDANLRDYHPTVH